MRLTKARMLLATVTAFALMVGVGTAIAATGGSDLKQEAARLSAKASADTSIAKSLGTTTAKLNAAIASAATARIDAALAAKEITSAEAETLKDGAGRRHPPGDENRNRPPVSRSGSARPRRSSTPPTATPRRPGQGSGRRGARGRQHHREVRDRAEGADRCGHLPGLRRRRAGPARRPRARRRPGLGFGLEPGIAPAAGSSSSAGAASSALALA